MNVCILSLSLSEQVCLYCVSIKQTQQRRKRLRDDSNWNSLDSILFRSLPREQKESARVCVYIYIYMRAYISQKNARTPRLYVCCCCSYVCEILFFNKRCVFCVEFWSADESFSLSLSLSLFLSRGGAFGMNCLFSLSLSL